MLFGKPLWYIRRVRNHAQSLLDALARVAGSGDLGPNVVAMSDALAGLRRERDRRSESLRGDLYMRAGGVEEQAYYAADDILEWLGLPREASWPDALDGVVVRGPSGVTVLDSVIQRLRADVDKLGAYLAEWAWPIDPIPEARLPEPGDVGTGEPRKRAKRTRKPKRLALSPRQKTALDTYNKLPTYKRTYAEVAREIGGSEQNARKLVLEAQERQQKIDASLAPVKSVQATQQLPPDDAGTVRPVGKRRKPPDD
jgi:hypothetical protein